jgi:hypothetical protein
VEGGGETMKRAQKNAVKIDEGKLLSSAWQTLD